MERLGTDDLDYAWKTYASLGVLYYGPGVTSRGLSFLEGFEIDAWAFLDYTVVPALATVASGSVGFFLTGIGSLELWGSENGTDWCFIDSATGGLPVTPFNLPIDAGDPAQFLSLRGYGEVMVGDLRIAVNYVLLLASGILLACGLGVLARLSRLTHRTRTALLSR